MRRPRIAKSGAGAAVLGALLIPLSILPIAAAWPLAKREWESFAWNYLDRDPAPAPDVSLAGAFRPLPEYQGAVPVLAYREISSRPGHYRVTAREFARQVLMLKRAKFTAVSPSQYVRLLEGERAGLPVRPVLITFDGARQSSWSAADQVLRRAGYRATMFAAAQDVGSSRYFLSWSELGKAAKSGRWDIQAASPSGNVKAGPGREGPAAVSREWNGKALEPPTRYRRRVSRELLESKRELQARVDGFEPLLFAAPFGDYGRPGATASNDLAAAAFYVPWLRRTFKVLFVQSDPVFSSAADLHGFARRYEVHADTSVARLYRWLDQGLHFEAWTPEERAAHLARRARELAARARCVPAAGLRVAAPAGTQGIAAYAGGELASLDASAPFTVRPEFRDRLGHRVAVVAVRRSGRRTVRSRRVLLLKSCPRAGA